MFSFLYSPFSKKPSVVLYYSSPSFLADAINSSDPFIFSVFIFAVSVGEVCDSRGWFFFLLLSPSKFISLYSLSAMATSSPSMTEKRDDKRVSKDLSDEFIEQLKEEFGLQNNEVTLVSGQTGVLKKTDVDKHEKSSEAVIVTRGKLELGLRFPLYNPAIPFYYEVLSQLRPYRALTQWNGNTFRLMNEWRDRGEGHGSTADWSTYKPGDAHDYTSANFIVNYRSGTATNGDLAGFAAIPHHQKSMPEGVDRLMLDDDPLGKGSNKRARHTNDPYWDRVPLLVRGKVLHGSFPPPQFPAALSILGD
ncbi:uncharacterized protein LOC113307975 [Papaver somniferum]|uniref:uncharacterized protein LOC113307975 n=1 Tax=Papaver somniferum TaxID=3469 RepID=UPI000E6F6B3A|nr:uncharacterized protein LOC113307975 [Papaver somniferum]XP_026412228.1 uncharacterized protein LOC113307975 [Papaver somniferum]